MTKIDLKATAKINLFLEITGRRENGYHDISTVMHTINLFDNISVANSITNTINITSDSDTMPTDQRNIAYKCAREFLSELNLNDGVNIYIEKKIPMEAGLAGGSADGAAVLKGLNELYDRPFSKEKLCEIGKRVGADIPFCVMGGTMLCEGIGEIMIPCTPLPEVVILVAKGGYGVSTKEAYQSLDSIPDRIIRENNMPTLLMEGNITKIAKGMFNCFEQLVPMTADIRNVMYKNGALRSMMSGSGSAVFGIFTESSDAMRAYDELRADGYFACIC